MSVPIRLQILVEGKDKAITDVTEIANRIGASIDGAAGRVVGSVEALGNKITQQFAGIAQTAGAVFAGAFQAGIGQLNSINTALTAMNANIEAINRGAAGMKFPNPPNMPGAAGGGTGSGGGGVVGAAVGSRGGDAGPVLEMIERLNLQAKGSERFVSARQSGIRTDQPMVDPQGKEFIARLRDDMLESLKPISEGLLSPETVRRTNEQISGLMRDLNLRAVEDSQRIIRANQRGVIQGRTYESEAGQRYEVQYRNVGDEEQFLNLAPRRGSGGVGGPSPAEMAAQARARNEELREQYAADARAFDRYGTNQRAARQLPPIPPTPPPDEPPAGAGVPRQPTAPPPPAPAVLVGPTAAEIAAVEARVAQFRQTARQIESAVPDGGSYGDDYHEARRQERIASSQLEGLLASPNDIAAATAQVETFKVKLQEASAAAAAATAAFQQAGADTPWRQRANRVDAAHSDEASARRLLFQAQAGLASSEGGLDLVHTLHSAIGAVGPNDSDHQNAVNWAERLLGDEAARQVAAHIPAGAKLLGAGTEAAAFAMPEGDVLRIGNHLTRVMDEAVVQATHRSVYRGSGEGSNGRSADWVVERVPRVKPVNEDDESFDFDTYDKQSTALEAGIRARGLHPVDIHEANVGYDPTGQLKVLDPGAVLPFETPAGSEDLTVAYYRKLGDFHRERMAALEAGMLPELPPAPTYGDGAQASLERDLAIHGRQGSISGQLTLSGTADDTLEDARIAYRMKAAEIERLTQQRDAALGAEQGLQAKMKEAFGLGNEWNVGTADSMGKINFDPQKLAEVQAAVERVMGPGRTLIDAARAAGIPKGLPASVESGDFGSGEYLNVTSMARLPAETEAERKAVEAEVERLRSEARRYHVEHSEFNAADHQLWSARMDTDDPESSEEVAKAQAQIDALTARREKHAELQSRIREMQDTHVSLGEPPVSLEGMISSKPEGGFTVHNSGVFIAPAHQGQGFAAALLEQQVRAIHELGGSGIDLTAAGGKGESMNGYSTWPKLGFYGDLGQTVGEMGLNRGVPVAPHLANISTMHELMQAEGGKQWWAENGGWWEGKFDTEPGSYSRDTLRKYREDKGFEDPDFYTGKLANAQLELEQSKASVAAQESLAAARAQQQQRETAAAIAAAGGGGGRKPPQVAAAGAFGEEGPFSLTGGNIFGAPGGFGAAIPGGAPFGFVGENLVAGPLGRLSPQGEADVSRFVPRDNELKQNVSDLVDAMFRQDKQATAEQKAVQAETGLALRRSIDDHARYFGGLDDQNDQAAAESAAEKRRRIDEYARHFGSIDDQNEKAAVQAAAEKRRRIDDHARYYGGLDDERDADQFNEGRERLKRAGQWSQYFAGEGEHPNSQDQQAQSAMMDELNAARAAGKVDSRLNDRQRAQMEALSGADLRRSADDHARYLAGLQATQEKEQAEAARQSNNAANMAYVQQGGFRNTSSSGPVGGPISSQEYERPAGLFSHAERVSVNLDTGQATRQIQNMTSLWSRFVATVTGGGGPIAGSINAMLLPLRGIRSVLGGIVGAWESFGNNLIRFSALFYSVERTARLLEGAFVGPYQYIVKSSEEARKFEMAISGVVGGMGPARAINDALEKQSRYLPMDMADERQVGIEASRISALNPGLALASPDDAAKSIAGVTDLVARLQTLSPDKSSTEVAHTLQSALEGNVRGLRLNLGIDPNDLAALAGMREKDLAANPTAMLAALQRYGRDRVPDSALAERGNLPSLQLQKIYDQFEMMARHIGDDSGLFDNVVGKFHKMMDTLADYIDTPQFHARAEAIGQSLGTILDNVAGAGAKFLQMLSGAKTPAGTADGVAEQVQSVLKHIADMSGSLPGDAATLGETLNGILSDIKGFIKELKDLHDTAANPVGALAHGWWDDKELRLDPEERERRRIDSLTGQMAAMGLSGATVGEHVEHVGPDPYALDGPSWGPHPGERRSYNLDTSSMQPKQALLATQMFTAWQSAQGSDTEDYRKLLAMARQAIPDFDKRLATANAKPAPERDPNLPPPPYQLPKSERDSFDKLGVQDIIDKLGSSAAVYGSKFMGANRQIAGFGDLAPENTDKFGETFTKGSGFMNQIFGQFKLDANSKTEKPGDFFDKVKEWRDAELKGFQQEIDHLRNDIEPGLSESDRKGIENTYVNGLQQATRIVSEGYQAAADRAKAALLKSTDRFEMGQVEAAKGETPTFRGELLNNVIGGNDYFQRRVGDRFGMSDADRQAQLGIASFRPQQQVALVNDANAAQIDRIKTAGETGGLLDTAKMSSADIIAMASKGGMAQQGSALFGQGQNQLEIAAYSASLSQASAAYDRIQGKLGTLQAGSAEADEAKRALDAAGESVATLAAKLREAQLAGNTFFQGMVSFANEMQGALTKGLGDYLSALMEGSKKMKDIWKSMAKEIIGEFGQSTSKSIMGSIFGEDPGNKGNAGAGGIVASVLRSSAGGGGNNGGGGTSGGLLTDIGQLLFGKPAQTNGSGGAVGATQSSGGADALAGAATAGGVQGLNSLIASGNNGANSGSSGGSGTQSGGGGGILGGLVHAALSLFGIGAAEGAVFPGGFQPFAEGGIARGGFHIPFHDPRGFTAKPLAFRGFADGGTVHGPTLGLVGERPDRMAEAIIPMPGGKVPFHLGANGDAHAILPGGRSIPASIHGFADGGIAQGGFGGGHMSGYHGGGGSGSQGGRGETHVHVYNVANAQEAYKQGYDANRGHILNDVLSQFRPGGRGRLVMNKVS